MWETVKTWTQQGVQAVITFFRELPSNLSNLASQTRAAVVNAFNQMVTQAKQWITDMVNNIKNWFKNMQSRCK